MTIDLSGSSQCKRIWHILNRGMVVWQGIEIGMGAVGGWARCKERFSGGSMAVLDLHDTSKFRHTILLHLCMQVIMRDTDRVV